MDSRAREQPGIYYSINELVFFSRGLLPSGRKFCSTNFRGHFSGFFFVVLVRRDLVELVPLKFRWINFNIIDLESFAGFNQLSIV